MIVSLKKIGHELWQNLDKQFDDELQWRFFYDSELQDERPQLFAKKNAPCVVVNSIDELKNFSMIYNHLQNILRVVINFHSLSNFIFL
jgi:hypothetical protein